MSKGHSSSISEAIETVCEVKPDHQKAEIWLKQTEYDMEALQVLFDSHNERLSGHVCFMANQVAEKVLQAGIYALVGLQPIDLTHHDLRGFTKKIEAESGATGLKEATDFLNHYLDTRYPNRYGASHKVPADVYNRQDAIEAKKHAEKLLKAIGPLVLQSH